MRVLRFLFCAFPAVIFFLPLNAQDFSNKGTDFWLGYGYHVAMAGNSANGGSQDMVLYFTSDKNANVTVDIPGVAYTRSYTVTANQVTVSDVIPKSGGSDARINGPGLYNRGIHITSDVPIVAYAHIYASAVSGASLLFPTNTLGKEYYSINFTQSSNQTYSNCFFFVVATEDNTSVEITPSAANLNGLTPGVPTVINLDKGEVYNVMGTTNGIIGTDLTGSKIRSISTGGSTGCKKIAVFSGSGKVSIGGPGNNGSADNFFAQAFPSVAWGKKYLTAPTGSQPNNYFRICVSDPSTVVKLNGQVLPASMLTNNFYYQFKNSNASGTNSPVPNLIEADKPVIVAQYCTTQGTEGNPNTSPGGDPEMIYLSPVEQTINNITLYSASKYNILQSYINVIIRKGGVSSFKLDGAQISSFQPHPQDTNYYYAIIPVSSGSHSLYSDTGFNAIAYGFGSAESYGYNAGTNVRDFTPVAVVQNPYNRVDSAVTCVNTPIRFSVPLSFQPTSLEWDFSAAPHINPSAHIGPLSNFSADSTVSFNGQTLYYYSTGNTYTFNAPNSVQVRDTVKLYTTSSTPDGCGSTSQSYTIPVTVRDIPMAAFSVTGGACVADSVHFTDNSSAPGGSVTRWLWDFGDGRTADLSSTPPSPIVFSSSGTHLIKLNVVSDIGCVSDTVSQSVTNTDKPVASFTASSLRCIGKQVSFTDASTTSSGSLVKWIWNLDNGGGAITNTSNAVVTGQYSSDGTFHPSLTVVTNTGCQSDPYQQDFVIHPTPSVGFTLPEVCLNDAFAVFNDTSSISDGTQAQFTWNWNFNAGTPAVSPGPSTTSSTVQHPQVKYNKADNYQVSLTVTSKDGCAATKVQAFTVNGANPKAAFSLTGTQPYCGTVPVVIQNNSTVDFGNVTRLVIYWEDGVDTTIQTVDDTPSPGKLYGHSYPDPQLAMPQNFTIRMVAYSGGTACMDGTSQSIKVYPKPKAAFSMSTAQICSGQTISFQDQGNGFSSAGASWTWNMGAAGIVHTQNPVQQFTDSGTIQITQFFVNQDGCVSDTVAQNLQVYPNPVLVLKHSAQVLSGGVYTIQPDFVYGNLLQYLWTPATYLSSDTAAMPVTTPADDITYRLIVTAQGGCTASDTIFIKVLKGPEVPNIFSPNGDGIHDTWHIANLDSYPGATVQVFDRFGQVVFSTVGYSRDWDGTYKGKPLPVGTYYYVINPKNGRAVVSGSVTIIR